MEAIYDNQNFLCVCEFLPNHLYFVTVQNINNGGSCDAIIPHTEDFHFFNTDTELTYHNFYGDFGPLSIACLYKFCKKLTNKLATYAGDPFFEKFSNSRFGRKEVAEKLREKFIKKKVIVYYTSTNNEKRANAAFLISSFAVLYLGFTPRLAHRVLQHSKLRYRPFQDASVGLSPYKISVRDCLDAIHKASVFGFFNFNDFNVSECSYYENIEHGDLNWIIPQKFLAFPGPVEEKSDYYHHPNFYVEYFLTNNVTDVIRLNQRAYDAKCFTMFNMKHHDLYMQDGADPPEAILKNFMNVAENAEGAIAVHCKAGLGRTGTLIGAYLLKHYRMTAREAIAWVRICRPGSVIGHQQTWLENHEEVLWCEGNEWRYKMYGKTEIVPFLPYGIYSFATPKRQFPGLRDLLTNLTKRARYRFILKNRPRRSRTKLEQTIKNILESGKTVKGEEEEEEEEEVVEEERKPEIKVSAEEEASYSPAESPDRHPKRTDLSKKVEYLKAPPQPGQPQYESESSQQEHHPKPRDNRLPTRYFYEYPSVQRKSDYYNPNNYVGHDCWNRSPTHKPQEMPKSRSADIPPKKDKFESGLITQSVDRHWKRNQDKYLNEKISSGKYFHKEEDKVCAFDSRTNPVYSRYGPNLGRQFLEQPRSKGKWENRSGFPLSPEDLHTWMESFQTQGDKLNAIKRSKIT